MTTKKIYSIIAFLVVALFAASCTSDLEKEGVGYLKLEISTLTSTHTRAVTNKPVGYDPRKLYVEIRNESNKIVSEGYASEYNKNITLAEGTYTVNVHSADWDGSGSGFDAAYYAGSTTARVKVKTLAYANISCKQENVKVTINYDDKIKEAFSKVETVVMSSIDGVNPLTFITDEAKSGYFPVGKLSLTLNVTNKNGKSHSLTNEIKNVAARDHYIINYQFDEWEGGITIEKDDSTRTYTYNILIPYEEGSEDPVDEEDNTTIEALAANTWSNVAFLEGTILNKAKSFKNGDVTIQYKEGEGNWKTISEKPTISGNSIKYQLENLKSLTTYSYQILYKGVASNSIEFTTKEGIYNNGFENWYTNGKIQVACEEGTAYWNSSNAGAATYIGSVTTQDKTFKHSGSSSAKLASKYAVVKFAAASLFTGNFVDLVGTKGAKLDWGVPFTSRPTALRGFLSYTAGTDFKGTKPSVLNTKPANDNAQIFCALVSEQFHVANTEVSGYQMTTEIDWEEDKRVIAYGELTKTASTSPANTWEEFRIELNYHNNETPTHLIIVCSASKWGDYFYGSPSSVLSLDDFTFEY